MTHIQHSPYTQVTSNGKGHMYNERYIDFLKFALHRIIETATFFESEAKVCKNSTVKLFLYFLAGKKRVQNVILEMIASSNQNRPFTFSCYSAVKEGELIQPISLSEMSAEFVLQFAHNKAEKDLNLYTSLAALEEDSCTKKLLLTLANLSRDFIEDITAGYTKFKYRNSSNSEFNSQCQQKSQAFFRL